MAAPLLQVTHSEILSLVNAVGATQSGLVAIPDIPEFPLTVRPIRFSSTGPDGWQSLPDLALDHAELLSGKPYGLDHAYFSRPLKGARAGIWRSTAYTERYEDYPTDEFMVVLEGEVSLEAEDFEETYRKGDCFLVPKGFKGVWRQPVDMLKFYVIIE